MSEVPEEGEDGATGCATVTADEAGNDGEGTVAVGQEVEQNAAWICATSGEEARAEEVKGDRFGIEEAKANHAEVHKDGIMGDEETTREKPTEGDKAAVEEGDGNVGEATAEEANARETRSVDVKAEEAKIGEVKEKEV